MAKSGRHSMPYVHMRNAIHCTMHAEVRLGFAMSAWRTHFISTPTRGRLLWAEKVLRCFTLTFMHVAKVEYADQEVVYIPGSR